MSGASRFEDLIAWQKARELVKLVYGLTCSARFAKDPALVFQIRKAVVSIASNIAEGFERDRPAEFHQYLSVAKASCAEVRTQLYLAFDVGHIDKETLNHSLEQGEEVGRIIGGLRKSVAAQKDQQRTKSSSVSKPQHR